jgi:nitroreductase
MLETIYKRRSIRAYTPEPVDEDQIDTLMKAAMAAPSANDGRPWQFVVVQDPARRAALAEVHPWAGMCRQAAAVIVVLGDATMSEHWVADCSAATENLLLAATEMGLGTVWVGLYPDAASETRVRQIVEAPTRLHALCLVPVGHPAEARGPRTRYEASKVHRETF